MKKLLVSALSVLALGCVESSAGPPQIFFDWGSPNNCPDLSAGGREASVIISGVDADNIADDEEIIFDCEDGASGFIDIQDGDWDFLLDVVDEYDDLGAIDPVDCFDSVLNGDDCLYYTTSPSEVFNVDTFLDFEPEVDVFFAYGYGNFTVDYTIDDLSPDETQCGGFGDFDPGATEMRVAMSFYNGGGRVDDLYVCGVNPVDTRDLPIGAYSPFFDLLDINGDPINEDPAVPNTPGGVVDILTHLENIVIEVDIFEF